MTLGRAKGAVLVGQALRLTVPIRLEAGDTSASLCFDADIFYGDNRQDASRITVTHDASPASSSANVYISAQPSVDEPVVTVYLRSGCENKTTRRFVMLAEPGNEAVAPAKAHTEPAALPVIPPVAAGPQATSPPVVDVAARSGSTEQDQASGQGHGKAAAKGTARVRAPKAAPDAAMAAPTVASTKPPGVVQQSAPARARLKLEPLDLTEIRDPLLRMSNELAMPAVEDLGKREQASALWRSLNATPQELQGADARRLALEADLKSLHDVTTKNQQLLQDLSGRLEQAESQRYANPLVYGLLVLLLLSAMALAYIWLAMSRRGVSNAPWWRNAEQPPHTRFPEVDEDAEAPTERRPRESMAHPGSSVSRGARTAQMPAKAPRPVQDVDIDLYLDEPAPAATPAAPDARRVAPSAPAAAAPINRAAGHRDFAHSMASSFRALNTQEMLDVRQQAEFFMTLGQHDEAVNMLKESIDTSAASNPLVYLDLLKVLHTLGRKAEYDEYRNGFNAIFSGHVPAYTEFKQGGSGLEAYPDVCNRIAALWPTEEAISMLEHCLVRDDSDKGVRGFDLEAFRDLLLLHSIAKRIAASLDSGFQPFSAVKSGGGSETGASFVPQLDRTQPIDVMESPDATDALDFDLSEAPPGNLIDFDTEDFAPSTRRPE